jgi:hypothetical protein
MTKKRIVFELLGKARKSWLHFRSDSKEIFIRHSGSAPSGASMMRTCASGNDDTKAVAASKTAKTLGISG